LIENKRIYCTYFDRNYLVQGLALIESLDKHDAGSEIYVLALDITVADSLKLFRKEINLISESELWNKYPQLEHLKKSRKLAEYYFTLTPFLMSYVSDINSINRLINYIDADLFYFDSPERIYEDFSNFDVGIIPHNYHSKNRDRLSKYGIYNVGLVIIRNSENGVRTLDWWMSRCEEWCEDKPSNGRYADQGYLNHFPEIGANVKIIRDPGANLAPWNIENFILSVNDQNKIIVDNNGSLIFFHFHGLKRYFNSFFPNHLIYKAPFTPFMRNNIYQLYIDELVRVSARIGHTINKNRFFVQNRSRYLSKISYIVRTFLFINWIFFKGDFIKFSEPHKRGVKFEKNFNN